MSNTRCEPPEEYRQYRWHWLKRDVYPEAKPVRWIGDRWSMQSKGRTPAFMADVGWIYIAPCIPPEPKEVEHAE